MSTLLVLNVNKDKYAELFSNDNAANEQINAITNKLRKLSLLKSLTHTSDSTYKYDTTVGSITISRTASDDEGIRFLVREYIDGYYTKSLIFKGAESSKRYIRDHMITHNNHRIYKLFIETSSGEILPLVNLFGLINKNIISFKNDISKYMKNDHKVLHYMLGGSLILMLLFNPLVSIVSILYGPICLALILFQKHLYKKFISDYGDKYMIKKYLYARFNNYLHGMLGVSIFWLVLDIFIIFFIISIASSNTVDQSVGTLVNTSTPSVVAYLQFVVVAILIGVCIDRIISIKQLIDDIKE